MSSTHCPKCGIEKTDETCARRSGRRASQFRGHCRVCEKQSQKEFIRLHPDRAREIRNRHYKKNRASIIAIKQKYNRANADKVLDWHLRRHFGITLDDYNRMLKKQSGVCAICKQPETATDKRSGRVRRLHVDHDHVRKQVRGLLCVRCNMALGYVKENESVLMRMIRYLRYFEDLTNPEMREYALSGTFDA